ncbi:hypothetical protein JA1_000832 [Spathaspora sp. JA1]|nr:hypothetical protein JA1_000832 [Spathaspora sp. JA1]
MSNSCPTCRTRFHKINISTKSSPDKIIQSIRVKDKLLPNSAINDIPSQFIIPSRLPPPLPSITPTLQINAQYYEEDEDDEEWGVISASGICSICSSSIFNQRNNRNQLITCRSCFSKFHLQCLGVSNPDQSLTWCCPICDYYQECMISRNFSTGTRTRTRTNNSILSSLMTNSSSRRSRPNLVIHNEHDELDIDFLYDNDDEIDSLYWQQVPMEQSTSTHSVMNGGVLRRREEKQLQQLTEEEKNSWSVFEQARQSNIEEGQDAGIVDPVATSSSKDITATSDKKRRRRKKITPLEHKNPDIDNSSQGHGRISNLINQLKAAPKSKPGVRPLTKKSNILQLAPPPPISFFNKLPINAESPGSSSPQSNSPMESSSYSNDSDTQYESDSKSRKRIKPIGLNLDQKIEIQNHLKSILRPLYKPGSEDTKFINTEEEYIRINKTISHQIYSHILNESIDDTGEVSSTLVDNYFEAEIPTKLKQVIDTYIKKELK